MSRVSFTSWVCVWLAVLVVGFGVGSGIGVASAAEAGVRGTWLTTTANDAIRSPARTAETMKTLADMGFNTVYVECWKNGYTEFPSETMRRLVGTELKINNTPQELQRDLLHETVVEAHRNGLVVIGWFEYGFMAAHKDTDNELREIDHLLTRTRDGRPVGDQNPFVWMNPLHPEAQQLLLDIVLEAVDRYDLDGVQLDDRIAMPVEMGYDPFTLELYATEHDGASPPDDPREPAWVAWRADKVTEYARRFAAELCERRPGLVVSVSPAPFPWSLENYACDWPQWATWEQDGTWLWDEFIPQSYRFDFAAFETNWRDQVRWMNDVGGGRTEHLVAGIRVVGDGPDTSWEDVAKKMDLSDELGGGYCIWFSRAVLEVYPDEFARYHKERGGRRNPHFPEGWRPAPVTLHAGGSPAEGHFADDAPAGTYRVVGQVGGFWEELTVIKHAGGFVRAGPFAKEADDVTLLLDRRPDMDEPR